MNEWNLATGDLCGPHTYEEPAPFCDQIKVQLSRSPEKGLAGERKMLQENEKS